MEGGGGENSGECGDSKSKSCRDLFYVVVDKSRPVVQVSVIST